MVDESSPSGSSVKEEHHSHAAEVHHEHQVHEKHKESATQKIMKYKKHILVSIFYLAVALVMFYAITRSITTVAPGTGADTYQNLWDIWWVSYAAFHLHTNVFFTKLLFWPLGSNLAFVTLAPLLGILSAPFQAVSIVFGYNIMFFLGFMLSGLTMFILADYLTKNSYASLIAGFVFSFSAFHIAQSYSHIHYMNIEWIPLFIYFMLKMIDSEQVNYYDILGMSITFALTTLMGNIEQTLMLTLAALFILIVYLFYAQTRKKVISKRFAVSIILFVVLALIIGLWNFWPLLKAVASPGGLGIANYQNNVQSEELWSFSPLAFFVPSYYNGLFYGLVGNSSKLFAIYAADPVERVGYIGYVVLILSLFAIYKDWKKMLPWAIGALIFGLLALGPAYQLYSIYAKIPALNIVREPGRFDLIVTLFFAILSAFGAKELFDYLSKHHGHTKSYKTKIYVLTILILLLMFIENNGMPLNTPLKFTTTISIPKLYPELANVPGNFSVLGLPTLPTNASNAYLYPGEDTFYSAITQKPLVGGYVGGRQNDSSTLLLYNLPLAVESTSLVDNGTPSYPSPVLENYTNETLLTLYNYDTEFVVVHNQAYNTAELNVLDGYLQSLFGEPVYNDNNLTAFQTYKEINSTLFRSFVAYPVLTQWEPTTQFVDGSYQTFWVPISPGSIIIYAPYSNISEASSGTQQYINATISFVATSTSGQTLYIGSPEGNTTKVIAQYNITTSPRTYMLKTILASGPQGNNLYFLYNPNESPPLLSNITFSR